MTHLILFRILTNYMRKIHSNCSVLSWSGIIGLLTIWHIWRNLWKRSLIWIIIKRYIRPLTKLRVYVQMTQLHWHTYHVILLDAVRIYKIRKSRFNKLTKFWRTRPEKLNKYFLSLKKLIRNLNLSRRTNLL